ncbi:hypothetical protein DCAR_0727728 [Daucus carota subsp. sativus]|uniref:F-box domain-containing protein n=1 Tax=Daucus carota subsp. sativus TaxID=79200 RepID=A0AAF0XI91_DAUCS|nr:PREDICTED: F-box/kelch-repeat protein At3g23880-like [Daucus carota subsp. sativus]WOH08290.1 hypothetical protein DCAR_0727728 [Daucus carota subsp. sativus]
MTISTADSRPIPSLPADIILEILQWLPVLSLLRFRSVCKLWLSLISTHDFIQTHLSKSTQFTHPRLILSSLDPHFNIFSVDAGLIQPSCEELEYPLKQLGVLVRIVGTCNGLVCVAFEGSLILWNPATRKSRRVCDSEVKLRLRSHSECVYGFGYDESNDDYKVVEIKCSSNYRGPCTTELKMYSSRSNCWRRIEDFPVGISINKSGKFAYGALHWVTRPPSCQDSWIIVSLDMTREHYGEVVQPDYGEGNCSLTLGMLGKYLSILISCQKCRWDVWVMKEYGVKESWTKLVTILNMDDPYGYPYTPLYIYANADLLLKFVSRIVVYNIKEGVMDLAITNFTGCYDCYEADTYVETLVSPDIQT